MTCNLKFDNNIMSSLIKYTDKNIFHTCHFFTGVLALRRLKLLSVIIWHLFNNETNSEENFQVSTQGYLRSYIRRYNILKTYL